MSDSPDDKQPSAVRELIVTVGAALLLAFLVQQFLVKPFRIPSASMENTLRCKDRVLVDRLSYRFSDPDRGDVVVFHPPAGLDAEGDPDPRTVAGNPQRGDDPVEPTAKNAKGATASDENYIKRIVAIPGDRLEVKGHRVYIDGKQQKEPYLRPLDGDAADGASGFPVDYGPVTIPKGTYLMMGDHRDSSMDGRFFGLVPRDFIVGGAFSVYWPLKRIGGLPDKDPGGTNGQVDPNCLDAVGEFNSDEMLQP